MTSESLQAVRLADVAARAGVARSVAGQVLHGAGGRNTRVGQATAQRVLNAARELDYRPNRAAQQLNGVRTRLLGALISSRSAQVHGERLAALERALRQHAFRLMVGHVDRADDILTYLQDFAGRGIEGLLLIDHLPGEQRDAVVRQLRQMPALLCAGRAAVAGGLAVDVDRALGIQTAVEHLRSRGRQRIGLALDRLRGVPSRARLRGYRLAMRQDSGRLMNEGVWSADLDEPLFDPHAIGAHVERMLDQWLLPGQFDAVLAADDLWAVQVVKALHRRGLRVPQDVAVVGFDNVALARACTPELTTIDQNNTQMAELAIPLLMAQLEGGSVPRSRRHVVIAPSLVVRESTS